MKPWGPMMSTVHCLDASNYGKCKAMATTQQAPFITEPTSTQIRYVNFWIFVSISPVSRTTGRFTDKRMTLPSSSPVVPIMANHHMEEVKSRPMNSFKGTALSHRFWNVYMCENQDPGSTNLSIHTNSVDRNITFTLEDVCHSLPFFGFSCYPILRLLSSSTCTAN